MALSEAAAAVKAAMVQVVADKGEIEALEQEWRDLLDVVETQVYEQTDGEVSISEEMHERRTRLRKRLAAHQLRNLAWMQGATLSALQRRVMRMRYLHGYRWEEILQRTDMTKQYLMREQNKALEAVAKHIFKKTQK